MAKAPRRRPPVQKPPVQKPPAPKPPVRKPPVQRPRTLFEKAGIMSVPVYTPAMALAAGHALRMPGVMPLRTAPGRVQVSVPGRGSMTLPVSAGQRVTGAILNGVRALGRAFPGGFVIASIFHSPKAGVGSDKVPGRDMAALFSYPATGTMLPKNHTLKPGDKSVNLPVRGALVNHNGQMAVKLVKTGKGSVPAQVPVLKAVRDPKTGLDG